MLQEAEQLRGQVVTSTREQALRLRRHGVRQSEIARQLGVSRQWVSQIFHQGPKVSLDLMDYAGKSMGQRLKMRRLQIGLPQIEVAELAGIARPHLARLENDKIAEPHRALIFKLAKVLQTSEAFLEGITDDPAQLLDLNQLTPREREFVLWLRSLPHEPTAEDTNLFFASQNLPANRQARAKG